MLRRLVKTIVFGLKLRAGGQWIVERVRFFFIFPSSRFGTGVVSFVGRYNVIPLPGEFTRPVAGFA